MSVTTGRHGQGTGGRVWAAGLSIFAAVIMITAGAFQALQGLAALIEDEFYVRVGSYAYAVDVTAWGVIHLLVGLGVAATGVFILRGARWARVAGIGLAVLSALTNFLFVPYYPVWSILIIALDVAVIWALAVYDPSRDLPSEPDSAGLR